MDRIRRAAFARYYQERVRQANAITPGQKKALIATLRQETQQQGRVPLASGPVRLDVSHPVVSAALEGRPVSLGGKTLQGAGTLTPAMRLQQLGAGAKIGLLAVIFLLPCLLIGSMAVLADAGEAPVALATASPTLTPSPSPTASTVPTQTPSPTMAPTQTPYVVEVTPTPYSLALSTGAAAPGGNDPASIEVAGFSYILSAGGAREGLWQPTGAEWLMGTELRRVVALPFTPDLANAVVALRPGTVLKLRLRSGEIVKYRVTEVGRRQRHEIEVLAGRSPSLAIVLHGEPASERWVILAEALQQPGDFEVYTAGLFQTAPPAGVAGPAAPPLPTAIPTMGTAIITDSQTITHTQAGLVLSVGRCERVQRIGTHEPPRNTQRFLLCQVTLTALQDGADYSAQSLAITEHAWIQAAADWWPQEIPVADQLTSGRLPRGGQVTGTIAGIVTKGSSFGRSSQPTLIWEQAGLRYLITLQPTS